MTLPSGPYIFTYVTDPGEALVVTGIGPIRRQDDAITVQDNANRAGSCHLTIGDHEGTTDPEPPVGANVNVETFGRRLFTGTVLVTRQVYEGDLDQLKWFVDMVDFTWQFNRLIPFGDYSGPADTVAADLIAAYAPGFTGTHIEAGLADVLLELDGSLTLGEVFDDICEQLGGAKWKVDFDEDVHLSLAAEIDEVPDDLVDGSTTLMRDPPVTYGRDITQIRTRVFVRGTGVFATVEDVGLQAALAALVGGDGIREAPVVSRPELTTEAECEAYGQALLTLWGQAITELDYYTRDPKTAAGKTVAVNLTDPPIVGDFLIQTVTTDEIGASPGLGVFPRYHVVASSVRYTLEEILRRQGSRNSTGNSATATRLQSGRLIHGANFDGSADIDLSQRLGAENSLRVLGS